MLRTSIKLVVKLFSLLQDRGYNEIKFEIFNYTQGNCKMCSYIKLNTAQNILSVKDKNYLGNEMYCNL